MTISSPSHCLGTRKSHRASAGDRRPIRRVAGTGMADAVAVGGRADNSPTVGRGRPPTSRSAGPPHGGSGRRGRVLSLPVLGAHLPQHQASIGHS